MATLLLGVAASALVGATGTTGIIASAITTAASLGGSLIDGWLFSGGASSQHVEGQRLESLQVLSSTEGAAIPIIAGWARVSGQVIWATALTETVSTSTQKAGGKGGGGAKVTTTSYAYSANFAIGLCEGPISKILRIWADGKELDLTQFSPRVYTGTETQGPDPLIQAKQGTADVPAYRGLAYVVFEDFALADYGNRIPQLTFEIIRSVGYEEEILPGVCLLPGATEFGYSPELVKDVSGNASTVDNNRHTLVAKTDWEHSLDLLQAVAPSVQSVALVAAWFGSDLRCESCSIAPRTEYLKTTTPISWKVAGLSRDTATLVSYVDGKPAFGGSPDDASLIAAIQDLKARGLKVLLYPFVMMDIPAGNGLPDPYGGGEQAAFPWRGKITCNPAIGQGGTPDKTAAAATQVAAFLGSAGAGHFSEVGGAVVYSGPAEWSYRRFILHFAMLAQAAGGVDSFVIGSEMPGMTSIRGAGNSFPFVDGLITLASEVRSIVGGATNVGYAADWSEYHSYRPNDGSGDVFFHLDALWANAEIDFIGIDNYMPLSDWRDGAGHLDHGDGSAGSPSIYKTDYLKGNIEGGELYHWYYASDADRLNQIRSPIRDTAYGEDWIFRQKDFRNWWLNAHYDRIGGVRSANASAWVPEGKPIWFTEFGCPAIDKGSNQPNVFFDPKSSESEVPHFSSGVRDDLIQRRFLRATVEYWQAASGNNPVSGVYGGRMVDTGHMFAWAWDVRPFPSFPVDGDIWADYRNFETGHWLSGRLGSAPADGVARMMLSKSGLTESADFDTAEFAGVADGFIIDNVTSARSVLETLGQTFFFDALESGGRIEARLRRSRPAVRELTTSGLVEQGKDKDLAKITRAQQTELPRAVRLTGFDSYRDFQTVTGEGLLEEVTSDRVQVGTLPIVMHYERFKALAENLLQDAWASRETGTFEAPPSTLDLEVGDIVGLTYAGRRQLMRLTSIRDGAGRSVTARSYDGFASEAAGGASRAPTASKRKETAAAFGVFIDGPLLRDTDNAWEGYMTGFQLPFRPGLVFLSSPSDSGFVLRGTLETAGLLGALVGDLPPGPLYRWDMTNGLIVELVSGTLQSLDDQLVLAGGNALLVQAASGDWELLQFANAELIASQTYRLTRLLRGQRGSENAMGAPDGARIVVLSGGAIQSGLDRGQVGLPLNWQVGPANAAIGSEAFAEYSFTYTGRGERPLSPVHLKARALAGGDVVLSWIRRTRIGGDGWETEDVPLGEASEAYDVEIWNDGGLVRTFSVPAETATYTVADQVADLGGTGQSFTFKVFQVSATYGRGTAATSTYQGDYQP
ncbi:baseplate multidomain protein megatron [Roseibium litorale]|uniref:Glycoside hydrolase/phage tail family protein n=1 Tax=Roseibium litorale TaxID=2803841 RepID=A0ABR9CTU4_9HYPH|nr:glycoside hydrolase/phage tail family protein [Roseibium litorale]MBD8894044.1 glycoside hydrolase/phage tail family protein [Roseibium litorale]